MKEYVLIFSKYLKKDNYLTYDIIFYENKFFCGTNLFKNFQNYLANCWELPVIKVSNYEQAEKHFLGV